jgi:hypothetical protein
LFLVEESLALRMFNEVVTIGYFYSLKCLNESVYYMLLLLLESVSRNDCSSRISIVLTIHYSLQLCMDVEPALSAKAMASANTATTSITTSSSCPTLLRCAPYEEEDVRGSGHEQGKKGDTISTPAEVPTSTSAQQPQPQPPQKKQRATATKRSMVAASAPAMVATRRSYTGSHSRSAPAATFIAATAATATATGTTAAVPAAPLISSGDNNHINEEYLVPGVSALVPPVPAVSPPLPAPPVPPYHVHRHRHSAGAVTSSGFTDCLLSLPSNSLLSVRVRVRPNSTSNNSKRLKSTNINDNQDNDDDDDNSAAAKGRDKGTWNQHNNDSNGFDEFSDHSHSLTTTTATTAFHGQAFLEIIKL